MSVGNNGVPTPRIPGGKRRYSGRKPLPSTIAKKRLGDYADDAMMSYMMIRKWRDDESLDTEFRFECAKEIMNRHWGKPAQAVVHSGNVTVLETILKSSDDA